MPARYNWPSELATVLRQGYTTQLGPPPDRTQMDDGLVQQAAKTGRMRLTVSFTAWVLERNYSDWMAWLQSVDTEEFNFVNPSGENWEASFVGGAASVTMQRVPNNLVDGERYWTAELQVEGWA